MNDIIHVVVFWVMTSHCSLVVDGWKASPYRKVQCVVSHAYDEHSLCNPVYLNCGVQSFVILL